ncbi:hypothetical protein [Variovorax sp. W2I14]|uniref:hypothetical protein n=1 Tax=Variovorax sp. W2I14 TaxID=3042290 RepID=UPI003D1E8288
MKSRGWERFRDALPARLCVHGLRRCICAFFHEDGYLPSSTSDICDELIRQATLVRIACAFAGVRGLARALPPHDTTGPGVSFDLGRLELSFGMELVLAAVVAAIKAQPRQESHPRAAAHALEMIDAAGAGRKQVLHEEGDLDVMDPLAKL